MNIYINPNVLGLKLRAIEQYQTTDNAEEYIVLKVLNNKLVVQGRSNSVQFSTDAIDCMVIEKGSVGAEFSLLSKLVHAFKGADNILLSYDEKNTKKSSQLQISGNNSSYNIPAKPAGEVPVDIKFQDDTALVDLSLKCESLYDSLCRVEKFAPSTDIGRPELLGNCVDITNQELTIVSCDGHRMAFSKIAIPDQGNPELDKKPKTFILPTNGIVKMLKAQLTFFLSEMVRVQLGHAFAQFTFQSGVTIKGSILDKKYVDWRRAVSQEQGAIINFNRKELHGALSRLSCLMDGKKMKAVRFEFKGNTLKLNAAPQSLNASIQTGSEVVAIDNPSDVNLVVGFNAAYLNDCIGLQRNQDVINLEVFDQHSACKVTYENTVAITMPLRV